MSVLAGPLREQPPLNGSANLAVKVTLKGGTLKLKNHQNNVKHNLGNKAGGNGNGGYGHQSNQQLVSSQPSLLGSSASGSNGNQRVVSRTGKGALRKLSVCVCNPLAPAPAPAPCSTETSEKQEKHKSGNSQQGKGKQHNNQQQQQQQRRNTCTGNNSQRSTVDASAGKPATKPVIEDDWLESMNTTSTTRTRKATKGTKLAPPGLGAPPGLKLPPPTTTQVPESTSSQGRRSDVASPATPPQQAEHGARPTSDATSNSKKSTAQAEIPPSSGNAAQASAAEQHPFPSHGEDDVSTLMLEQQAQRLLKEKSEAVANADALARRVAQLEEQVRWLSASQDDDDVPWLDDDEDNEDDEDDEDDGACTAPRDLQ